MKHDPPQFSPQSVSKIYSLANKEVFHAAYWIIPRGNPRTQSLKYCHCGFIFLPVAQFQRSSGAFAVPLPRKKKELESNFGGGLVRITSNWITPNSFGRPLHLLNTPLVSHSEALPQWTGAPGGRFYSIRPVLKLQISHGPNCFHPALIKDVIKGGKNFSEHGGKDGGDGLRGLLLTEYFNNARWDKTVTICKGQFRKGNLGTSSNLL